MLGKSFLLDEIVVLERNALEFLRHFKDRVILNAGNLKHFLAYFLHDACARIVGLVNPMPKAGQPELILLVLRALDVKRDAVGRADFHEHLQGGFVGAAVCGAP